jgi:hypothetical protein
VRSKYGKNVIFLLEKDAHGRKFEKIPKIWRNVAIYVEI